MGSSILGEVHDTSILRTELPTRYRAPLGWLQASRLLPPRSGLERSDFVHWPLSDLPRSRLHVRSWGVKQTQSETSESDGCRRKRALAGWPSNIDSRSGTKAQWVQEFICLDSFVSISNFTECGDFFE